MFKAWFNYFKTMMISKKGQGMVEYGLIIGVVAVMLIAALVTLRGEIAGIFTGIGEAIANPPAAE